ncbi:MAG: hypothetical protein M3Q16_01285 [Pseudomonadota bacterium]|nr:hypothetical protein [Pseudomonadota bacterium]
MAAIMLFIHLAKTRLVREGVECELSSHPTFNNDWRRFIMRYLKPVLTAATLALALAACDSKQEDRRENVLENKADSLEKKADNVRDRGEAAADRIEKQDPGMDSKSTDRAAEAARETSESRADKMEDKADRIREKK